MRYVTGIERMAMQKGEQTLLRRQLTRRLGEWSEPLQSQIEALSLTHLEALGESLLDFNSVEDLIHWLASHPAEAS